jgi:hypothetical protein
MSDPRRWLDSTDDATPLERDLLARELAATPPPELESAVWKKLLPMLPPIGGAPDAGSDLGGADVAASAGTNGAIGASTAKIGAITIAKALVVGALAGTAAMTGVAEVGHRFSSPPAVLRTEVSPGSSIVAVEEKSAPRLDQPQNAPALSEKARGDFARPRRRADASDLESPAGSGEGVKPEPELPATESIPSAGFEVPAAPRDLASDTRAERMMLQRARAALRSGDPATALSWIETARSRFAGGVLAQEREVLTIEALSAAGRKAEAGARARAFLGRFPDSPHVAHVQRFAN